MAYVAYANAIRDLVTNYPISNINAINVGSILYNFGFNQNPNLAYQDAEELLQFIEDNNIDIRQVDSMIRSHKNMTGQNLTLQQIVQRFLDYKAKYSGSGNYYY